MARGVPTRRQAMVACQRGTRATTSPDGNPLSHPMSSVPFEILYEDNHLLAINKPANLPTMGVESDRTSLLSVAKHYIKQKYHKPGNVYLGIVSRLDAPVTGVVLIARTSKAAARISDQFRRRKVLKRYWALVEQAPSSSVGTWRDWLRKDERHRKVSTAMPGDAGAQEAILTYQTLDGARQAVLLEIDLETGRKHQIRVQLASHGLPVLGDRKYGSAVAFPQGIALHARELQFLHPTMKTRIRLVADLPAAWRRYLLT
jgi:23S rRNA pseudouridine1911/1915/1917 synthase